MHHAILGIAVAAGFAASFLVEPASADPYRWCAIYSGGMGGFCTENRFYTGPGRTVRYKRKRHID